MGRPKEQGKSVLNLREPVPDATTRNKAAEILWYLLNSSLILFRLLWTALNKLIPSTGKSYEDEVVLITGAGHGIGRELAHQYVLKGATVVCWDINEEDNNETVAKITQLGFQRIYGYVCNVADRNDVIETAKKVQVEVGSVTILINNAEIMPYRSFLQYTADEIAEVANTNIMGHFWTLRAFLPTMLKNNHGHIVAVSSCAGLGGIQNLAPYSASKFAIRGMMESLLQELEAGPKCHINTTVVYPYALNIGPWKKSLLMSFPKVMTFLNPKFIAKCIVEAQSRNISETTVPWLTVFVIYCLQWIPVKMLSTVRKYLGWYLEMKLCNCFR